MKYKNTIILTTIFIIILALRLFIAFQTTDITYDGYYTLRNIENIKETGLPLFEDKLSNAGRENVFSPLYYYILTLFSIILSPILALKIMPNIFATSIILVVFLFAKRLSKNDDSALIAAGASALIPVFFSQTINNASIYSLVIPLFFLTLYYFLKTISNSKNLWKFLGLLIILSLAHASSLILAFGLLIYVALLKIQGFKKSTKEPELLLFSIFLIIWANLTIYKQAIMMHGSEVIYQNTPIQLIMDLFRELTFIESLYWIGVIPLLFGMITIYDSVFESKKKSTTSLIAICITLFLFLWFKLINLHVGLMFLGVSMSILSSGAINKTINYAKNSKLKIITILTKLILIALIITSFTPTIIYSFNESTNVPSTKDKELFEWIKNNTKENTTILSSIEESSAMSYYTKRKNFMDQQFLLINKIDERYKDAQKIYSERFLIPALTKLNYYSIDYILLSDYTIKNKNITKLFYEDSDCITNKYPNKTTNLKLYKVNCIISLEE